MRVVSKESPSAACCSSHVAVLLFVTNVCQARYAAFHAARRCRSAEKSSSSDSVSVSDVCLLSVSIDRGGLAASNKTGFKAVVEGIRMQR